MKLLILYKYYQTCDSHYARCFKGLESKQIAWQKDQWHKCHVTDISDICSGVAACISTLDLHPSLLIAFGNNPVTATWRGNALMAAMMPVVPLHGAHRNGLGMSFSNSGFSYAVGGVCFCSHSDFWKDFQTVTNWLFPGSVFFWKFSKINQLTDDNGSVFHKGLGVNENRRSLHRGLRVEVWHQVPIRCGQKSGVVKWQAFWVFSNKGCWSMELLYL